MVEHRMPTTQTVAQASQSGAQILSKLDVALGIDVAATLDRVPEQQDAVQINISGSDQYVFTQDTDKLTKFIDLDEVSGSSAQIIEGNTGDLILGANYLIYVKQHDSSPKTLNWTNVYRFPGGTDPVITVGANRVDMFLFKCLRLGFGNEANTKLVLISSIQDLDGVPT